MKKLTPAQEKEIAYLAARDKQASARYNKNSILKEKKFQKKKFESDNRGGTEVNIVTVNGNKALKKALDKTLSSNGNEREYKGKGKTVDPRTAVSKEYADTNKSTSEAYGKGGIAGALGLAKQSYEEKNKNINLAKQSHEQRKNLIRKINQVTDRVGGEISQPTANRTKKQLTQIRFYKYDQKVVNMTKRDI